MKTDDIVNRLRELSEQMIQLGTEMDYFGGFNAEIAEKGKELAGAGMIAKGWADDIEKIGKESVKVEQDGDNR